MMGDELSQMGDLLRVKNAWRWRKGGNRTEFITESSRVRVGASWSLNHCEARS